MRRRIRSVRNTQQITKAMKMMSAAKLRRAQDRAIAARPYAAMLRQILANVAEAAAQVPMRATTRCWRCVRKADPDAGDHGRSRSGRRLQRQPAAHGAALRDGTSAEELTFRTGRPKGPRFFPQTRREDQRRTSRPVPRGEVRRRGTHRAIDHRPLRESGDRRGLSCSSTNLRA